MYLYDIAHNQLYRITDTPGVYEDLSEVTVLPDGRIRMVWASGEDGFDRRNIKAVTFSLPTDDTTPPVINPIANITVTLPLNSTATSTAVTFPLPTAKDDSGWERLVQIQFQVPYSPSARRQLMSQQLMENGQYHRRAVSPLRS